MFLAAPLLTQVLLALSTTGSPVEVRNSPIAIPLTRRLNFSNGTINLLQHDKARVAALRNYNTHGRRADIIPVSSFYFGYQIAVGIGSPPTMYDLILDTASSVTWVHNDVYVQTTTSVDTGQRVREDYGDEIDSDGDGDGDESDDLPYLEGIIWNDSVTLGGLTVAEFQLGIATEAEGVRGQIGILGIGPTVLSLDTLIDEPDKMSPTITDYLYDQGKIDEHVVGIFFQPITAESEDSLSGEVTFGGTDNTKYFGNVVYTLVTIQPPASEYWGINQRITYGSTEILGTTAGIVDTGAILIYIASDAFEKYKDATGATYDEHTELLRITEDQYSNLQNLDFHIGGQTFSLTPNAQIWPRSLNDKHVNADPNGIYLIVGNTGRHSGQGDDFSLGHAFLQRFYTVLDGSSSPAKVGFAKTVFTDATTN
ncbi:aspartic peptidase domain-containing protein [Suillus spraguei]|nr:aspartic peptidase domain-containing protein [Suillus spraguei]